MALLVRLLLAFVLVQGLALRPLTASAEDDDYDEGFYDDAEDDYDDDAPDPADYDEALAPHGDWVEVSEYGHVWRPWVASGWRPYVDGYWAWSPHGWLWVSYEPWAWTFHYGRWVYAPLWGWVWVPGTVWGPAWVDWYWGEGFVGWAPLGPFVTHVTVIDHFIFIPERHFCSRGLSRKVVHHRRMPEDVVRRWRQRDSRPPARERIERVSEHRVERVDRRPPHTVAPARRRDAGTRAERRRDERQGGERLGRARPEDLGREQGVRRARPTPYGGRQPSDPGRDRQPGRSGDRPSMSGVRPAPPAVPGGVTTRPPQRHGGGAPSAERGGGRQPEPGGASMPRGSGKPPSGGGQGGVGRQGGQR